MSALRVPWASCDPLGSSTAENVARSGVDQTVGTGVLSTPPMSHVPDPPDMGGIAEIASEPSRGKPASAVHVLPSVVEKRRVTDPLPPLRYQAAPRTVCPVESDAPTCQYSGGFGEPVSLVGGVFGRAF